MDIELIKRRIASKIQVSNFGCWEWTGAVNDDGYGRIWVSPRYRRAHRVSYEVHVGPVPEGMLVCHSCDNPMCVNPGHLFLGTHTDNMRDMHAKGRGIVPKPIKPQHGEHGINAKLTTENVLAIREAVSTGAKQVDLARRFGMSKIQISRIVRGERWAHIPLVKSVPDSHPEQPSLGS